MFVFFACDQGGFFALLFYRGRSTEVPLDTLSCFQKKQKVLQIRRNSRGEAFWAELKERTRLQRPRIHNDFVSSIETLIVFFILQLKCRQTELWWNLPVLFFKLLLAVTIVQKIWSYLLLFIFCCRKFVFTFKCGFRLWLMGWLVLCCYN